jgi:hypothetical protein
VPELHGWTLKLMPDRDDVMAIWACDPDGTYVYLAAAPSQSEDANCSHTWVTDGIGPTRCSKCLKQPEDADHGV